MRYSHSPITTICYGIKKNWDDPQEAFNEFAHAALHCEGSERERYSRICAEILSDKQICMDYPEDYE